MKVLIVGLGSIGRRHLANLRALEPSARVAVWRLRSRPDSADPLPAGADRVVYTLQDALDTRPRLALITCPASLHVEMGLALARHGIHLFIEKPLSHSLQGVDELLALCHQKGLALAVGYNLRFHAPLQAMRKALVAGEVGRLISVRAEVGQYLPDWRPGTDYRQSVSARQDLGGGAVLELSHELDYVRWLAGEVRAVTARIGRFSDLEIDVEDTAEVLLDCWNGALGSVHLDMVQRPATRICRILGTEGTLLWDKLSQSVQIFTAAVNRWADLHPASASDPNETYLSELRQFLDCVRGEGRPVCGGEDARRVLEIALAAKQSSREGRTVEV